MKKLTAGIFATLLAVVSVGAANAEIASKGYVDQQVDTVEATVANKADSATVTALDTRVETAEGEIDTLQTTTGQHTTQIGTINTTLSKKLDSDTAASTYQTLANKTTSVSGDSTDTQYPSAKAVWTAVQSVDANASVEALEGRVDSLETNSATKTELATKQNKNMGSSAANSIVTTDGTGNITASATIAASKVSGLADVATSGAYSDLSGKPTIPTVDAAITEDSTNAVQSGAVYDALAAKANTADLGDLATLDAVGSAQITDGAVATDDIASKAVTKEKLAEDIVTSLGKADTALQQASLNDYVTKTAADAAYADIATETTASTANTNAQTALTNIGTLTNLTTEAKTNTVAAINEVATEAAAAASAASAADTKAVAAQGAAEAAQADVDALETTVSEQGTRLTTAEGEIDTIQGQISNMATSETVKGLQSTVTNLQNTKQDKTDNTLTTTSKTVVGAINEVKTQADKGVSDAATAKSAADAAQEAAETAQETANAAIPKPNGECASGTAKCVLTFNNSVYAWEVIARDGEGE